LDCKLGFGIPPLLKKTANQYENVPRIALKNKAMSILSREKDQNIGWKNDEGGETIAAV